MDRHSAIALAVYMVLAKCPTAHQRNVQAKGSLGSLKTLPVLSGKLEGLGRSSLWFGADVKLITIQGVRVLLVRKS